MTFSDKALPCCDCGATFVFTAGEQEFFATKQLVNEPKRCTNCRVLTRLKRIGRNADEATKVDCHECGTPTIVPFKPTGCKPVYCGACLRANRSVTASPQLVTAGR